MSEQVFGFLVTGRGEKRGLRLWVIDLHRSDSAIYLLYIVLTMGLDLLSASPSSPSGCACRETRSRAARFDDQLWLALLFPRSACSFSKVLDDLGFQVTRVRDFLPGFMLL